MPQPAKRQLVSRRPLGAQIADHLRQEIILGRLSPGDPVSQEQLCEVYGTSRMPVRDALMTLTNEGLVVTTPGGHSVVAGVSRYDIKDAFEIGGIVHGRAARRVVERASDDEIAELRELQDQMDAAIAANDMATLAELNWRFHRRINQLSASPKLIALMRILSLEIPQSYLNELPDWAERVGVEHRAIVDAIEARDADEAERVVIAHLRAGGEHLIAYLESLGRFAEHGAPQGSDAG